MPCIESRCGELEKQSERYMKVDKASNLSVEPRAYPDTGGLVGRGTSWRVGGTLGRDKVATATQVGLQAE